MATRGTRLDWLIFIALGFFWGSSYLFIRIGVQHGLQPFSLIMFRLLIGFTLLASVVAVAPLRESAIVLASGWGSFRLGEAASRADGIYRIAAAALVVVGAVMLAID